MLVGVQRLSRVLILAVVGSYRASTILFKSPLSFIVQAFFLYSLLFSISPLHCFDIALILLLDPRLPFLEFHQISLNRLLRLLDLGFKCGILIVWVLREFAQNQFRVSVKVQVSFLKISILLADSGFRKEHLRGSKPAFHRSVWNEFEVLRFPDDFFHGQRP